MKKRGSSIFDVVAMRQPAESSFDLSHDTKTSFRLGELIPYSLTECLPGDRHVITPENMLRFAPLISPVMHRVKVRTSYFFVPTRILWPEFEDFITGKSDVFPPYFNADQNTIGSLADYLGIPTGIYSQTHSISAIPFAAYQKVWDDCYRAQQYESETFSPLVPGPNDTYANYLVTRPFRTSWEHDYFTSALPFPQAGPDVLVPLTREEELDIEYRNNPGGVSQNVGRFRKPDGSFFDDASFIANNPGPSPLSSSMIGADPAGTRLAYDPAGTLKVDVQGNATDINTLRRAFRLQEWLEKNARGGQRYIESILTHFGIRSSDARLQRPEHIKSFTQNMIISEVLATAQSEGVVPVGQMAGHGIAYGGGQSMAYKCEEHGYIIGLVSVIPDTAYQQGIHPTFQRFNRFDYAWPTFANLGERAIKLKELYVNGGNGEDTFGYIPQYSEYKFKNSQVSGQMRGPLSSWHIGRVFENTPTLSSQFVRCSPRLDIFAVNDENEDHIFAHLFVRHYATRKLPRFGIPTI